MKILITGSSGMLGRALCQEFSDKYEIVGLDIVEFKAQGSKLKGFIECDITDITDREKTIANIVSAKPNIVIHTAAYTDVDGCEENPEKAHRINALGTETVALACQKCDASLYYISTDFVFDGKKKSTYTESDSPNPINIYGKSNLDGERFVQSISKRFIISISLLGVVFLSVRIRIHQRMNLEMCKKSRNKSQWFILVLDFRRKF